MNRARALALAAIAIIGGAGHAAAQGGPRVYNPQSLIEGTSPGQIAGGEQLSTETARALAAEGAINSGVAANAAALATALPAGVAGALVATTGTAGRGTAVNLGPDLQIAGGVLGLTPAPGLTAGQACLKATVTATGRVTACAALSTSDIPSGVGVTTPATAAALGLVKAPSTGALSVAPDGTMSIAVGSVANTLAGGDALAAEIARAQAAEGASVKTSQIGTTVAPLVGGLVPQANLPASATGGVQSVNGKNGSAITLAPSDIGALPATAPGITVPNLTGGFVPLAQIPGLPASQIPSLTPPATAPFGTAAGQVPDAGAAYTAIAGVGSTAAANLASEASTARTNEAAAVTATATETAQRRVAALSLKDFGAPCDGGQEPVSAMPAATQAILAPYTVTSSEMADTAAFFAAAANVAVNGQIIVPAGSCAADRSWALPSNTTLIGQGRGVSTIKAVPAALTGLLSRHPVIALGTFTITYQASIPSINGTRNSSDILSTSPVTNVAVRNLTCDGSATAPLPVYSDCIGTAPETQNVTIDGIEAVNAGGTGFYANGASHLRVANSEFHQAWTNGVFFRGAELVKTVGNLVAAPAGAVAGSQNCSVTATVSTIMPGDTVNNTCVFVSYDGTQQQTIVTQAIYNQDWIVDNVKVHRNSLGGAPHGGNSKVVAQSVAAGGGNAGNETVALSSVTLNQPVTGNYVVAFTSPTAFTVTDPNGATGATGTIDVPYGVTPPGSTPTTSISLTVASGTIAPAAGDTFTIAVVSGPWWDGFDADPGNRYGRIINSEIWGDGGQDHLILVEGNGGQDFPLSYHITVANNNVHDVTQSCYAASINLSEIIFIGNRATNCTGYGFKINGIDSDMQLIGNSVNSVLADPTGKIASTACFNIGGAHLAGSPAGVEISGGICNDPASVAGGGAGIIIVSGAQGVSVQNVTINDTNVAADGVTPQPLMYASIDASAAPVGTVLSGNHVTPGTTGGTGIMSNGGQIVSGNDGAIGEGYNRGVGAANEGRSGLICDSLINPTSSFYGAQECRGTFVALVAPGTVATLTSDYSGTPKYSDTFGVPPNRSVYLACILTVNRSSAMGVVNYTWAGTLDRLGGVGTLRFYPAIAGGTAQPTWITGPGDSTISNVVTASIVTAGTGGSVNFTLANNTPTGGPTFKATATCTGSEGPK